MKVTIEPYYGGDVGQQTALVPTNASLVPVNNSLSVTNGLNVITVPSLYILPYSSYRAELGLTGPVENTNVLMNGGNNLSNVVEGGSVPKGTLTGKLDGLTTAERTMVDDLLNAGNNVEIIPRSNIPGNGPLSRFSTN